MEQRGAIRPMRFGQSLLFFVIPGLYAAFSQYVIFPSMVRLGISEENAYNTSHLTGFLGLLIATFIAVRMEGWALSWVTMKDRLRFRRMSLPAWRITLPFLVLYLLAGLVLSVLAQFVYERLGFWPPGADIPLTNIPFTLIVLVANVIGEEFWWRGYILPRQELAYGKSAWIVNGLLWSFFHLFKWWAVPFMILKHWMIPFVAQRTKNTAAAALIHFVSNGIGVLLSILPLLAT